MKTLLAVAASLGVIALGTFDITAAGRVRCVPATDQHRVVTLADLDDLGFPATFHIRGTLLRRVAAGDPVVVRGSTTIAHDRGGPATAVLGRVDGGSVVRAAYDGREFRLSLAPRDLARGTHRIAFVVVAGDLSGLFTAPTALTLEVR